MSWDNSFTPLSTRTDLVDANAAADVNQLEANRQQVQTNVEALKGGTPATSPTKTLEEVIAEKDDGWIIIDDTLTYASATTINTASDLTGIIEAGMKLKINQSGDKFFVVLAITSSLITVTGGDDYTVANAAISSPYYSMAEKPYEFPSSFSWTPSFSNLTVGNGTLAGEFSIIGNMLHAYWDFTLGSTSSVDAGITSFVQPVDALLADNSMLGNVNLYDVGAAFFLGFLIKSSTNMLIYARTVSGVYIGQAYITGGVPFTWTTGDIITVNFSYPVF